MIGAAYQQGTHVRVISPEGQILFTQKGKLLGFSSEAVSILKGNAIHICDHQGNTLSTHRYTDGKPAKAGSSKSILFYLLLGCLVKIGDAYRLYQFLGRGNTIGTDGGDLNWKNIGIWILSCVFYSVCLIVIIWMSYFF
ncbi:hypothetical protein [Akkermansia sp.]|uniref:hypothetical protein n=1 Tax=Akkermansia sp. TaxID=1872421 RepID=UPI0025C1158C|nr:hypothetical protein [Akkermansia sp.]MCC8149585.1 hypothetical protein [Akkermansia sp.]